MDNAIQEFHRPSHHGLGAIIPRSTNMVSVCISTKLEWKNVFIYLYFAFILIKQ